jgi:hypothetical protein
MGKSRLLAEVGAIAHSFGIRIGASAADPSETVVELSALLATLFNGSEPLLDASGLPTVHAQPKQRVQLLRDLKQLLESSALESPLLIAVDDAQWADGGTIATLRTAHTRAPNSVRACSQAAIRDGAFMEPSGRDQWQPVARQPSRSAW